jgi:hypothetical protein
MICDSYYDITGLETQGLRSLIKAEEDWLSGRDLYEADNAAQQPANLNSPALTSSAEHLSSAMPADTPGLACPRFPVEDINRAVSNILADMGCTTGLVCQ